ncbi:SDR family oxidoreductase [Shimia sediminis]|uniref:SDR family oxidoreductase n=1 Tax=Shimia sediminis TaxID=2497945 RepID=UPI000F8F0E9B|nr:SDR family oxidoreductase [Shimia sediminis]
MNRRVLITAGASGIGRAMAEAFDQAGYQVWISDLNARLLDEAPGHWRRSHVDVVDEAQMAAMFDEVRASWGGLDVLCANAGVAGPTAQVENIALEDWRACVSVNLDGAFLAAKHAVPMMKEAGSGSIIVTSSTAGQYGYPNRSPYCAAKWAVIGLAKTLAMELGPHGGRCNVICPGSVEGERMEGVLAREAAAKGMTRDQVYAGYASGTSMGSFVEARDIGEMAVFLGSDAARFVSGQVIAVDGHTVNPDPKV